MLMILVRVVNLGNARPADAGDAGLCRGSGKARPTNDDDAGLWRGFWILEKQGRVILMTLVCAMGVGEACPADADDAGPWRGFWKSSSE